MNIIKRATAFLLAVTLSVLILPNIKPTATEDTFFIDIKGSVNYDYAFEVLKQLNSLRSSLGLAPLKMDYTLMEDAMLRAAESAVYFSHTRPSGKNCFTAFTDPSYTMGENIAIGHRSPTAVMNGWKNSSGHYQNMIKDSYTSVGIGCYMTADGVFSWSQLFNGNTAKENTVTGTKDICYSIEAKREYLGLNLSFDKKACPIKIGYTLKLKIDLRNVEFDYVSQMTENSSYIFTSSDPDVIEFDSNGIATVKADGISDITVSAKNSGALLFSFQYQTGHVFTDCCDTSCDFCGATRSAPHSAKPSPCDEDRICAFCGENMGKGTSHKYSGAGDEYCDLCNFKRELIYIKGDADGDQKVTTTDLATLKLYLAQIAELEEVSKKLCDLDGDKNVNTVDLAMLKLKLAGIE
ncbi:MAG: hypothetical protein E7565_09765 [Ruminococcaceae bacterium]|nr:hypothetical protein [Oscillospiraceae bacterium]